MTRTTALPALALALATCLPSAATAGEARDAAPAAVVELFTSEGCSSCPPAEAVLGHLAQRGDVITLAHHVTYWDGLGWRDRFGSPSSDRRQSDYVHSLGLSGAYTPQAVVNGRMDVLGSDRNTLERAIAALDRPARIGLERQAGQWMVRLPPLPPGRYSLRLLGVRRSADTAVGGGENRGRTVHATSIVRSMQRLAPWQGEATERAVSIAGQPEDVDAIVVLAARADGRIVADGSAAAAR